MEITFTANVKQPVVVNLDPLDKQAAEDMAVSALIKHVEFGPFDYINEMLASRRKPVTLDDHIIQMCRKYGVDSTNKEDRVNFFKAVFSQLKEKDEACPQ